MLNEQALKRLPELHFSHDHMHCISFKRKINIKTVIAKLFVPLRVFFVNFYQSAVIVRKDIPLSIGN